MFTNNDIKTNEKIKFRLIEDIKKLDIPRNNSTLRFNEHN